MCMKASDIFGIIVRTAGLLILVYGLWLLGMSYRVVVGVLVGGASIDSLYVVAVMVVIPAIGLGLLRGASRIVAFSYPCRDATTV